MAREWSRSGLDLHLPELDRRRGVRAGLEEALRDAVRQGRLSPGTKLPSSRALARELGIARGTVTQAYDQLVAEGYLRSYPRSGIQVAARPTPATALRRPATGPASAGHSATPGAPATPEDTAQVNAPERAAGPARAGAPDLPGGSSTGGVGRAGVPGDPAVAGVDMRPGMPDLATFPRREWLAATRHVLQTAPNAAFGYGDSAGSVELRAELAGYLGRARGVVTTADQIIVCAGYGHALQLLSRTLARHAADPVIAFEEPFLPEYPPLAEETGLAVRYIPVDGGGLVVGALEDGPASGVVVTPAHQYPLGVTLSPDRRTRLVDWACRTGGLVIEDDYDGEFRYDRQPVGALQGMAPDQVVYAGTVSKTIAPGLRIAWLAVPAGLVPAIRDTMRWDDGHVSVIDQLVLARLIASGELDRHLRRCRIRYRRRRDRLGEEVARRLPDVRLSGIAAGLHAVLEFPGADVTQSRLLAHATRMGVTVEGLATFYHRPEDAPLGVVVGYTTPPEHAYENALEALVTGLERGLA
ncbi:PLP-dependent aminotransferase family protein [Spirillospora sp. NPDC047279]|uniref:MocR-like pyridoxine biosynthesis transcription factor PdxR n=1 Tax=Spirillospora sp. NPDC047279 TaxID=3155478 RepID=UPI0033EC7BD6